MIFRDQKGITTFWGISIILMESVVVLFVFYILYFFWIENPTPTSNILIVKVFNDQSLSIPKDVDTTGWQIYKNESYGFTLMYPAGYSVSGDEILYNDYQGSLVSLDQAGAPNFSLRLFPIQDNESISLAYERLSNIDASIYQSFNIKIDGTEAVVYRMAPGEEDKDTAYFISNDYLFEVAYNADTVPILSTFKFMEE